MVPPAPPQSDEFLTENAVRDLLLVSKVTLKAWRDSGKINFYRIGSRIRYKKSELLAALESPKKYERTA